ncbi:protein FAM107B isoform X3 [Brachyhypopomus gauderio]|uniref:protein FAM107B isoform X3 n=1 Tax=Brachyhypopomus gauderio TaxID=698409 RepID=UPI004042833D
MRGLPCASLQHCFGASTDVPAEPDLCLDSEHHGSRARPIPTPAVLSQPGAARAAGTQHQQAVSCISLHTKTNGVQTKESVPDDKHIFHASSSTKGLSEEVSEELSEGLEEEVSEELSGGLSEDDRPHCIHNESPIPDTKYPHIPRPSIIKLHKEQESLTQEVQANPTGHIETEDGPLSDLAGSADSQ